VGLDNDLGDGDKEVAAHELRESERMQMSYLAKIARLHKRMEEAIGGDKKMAGK